MGNKESRGNDRDSRDYSSNNQPRELAFSTLLDREINRTAHQPREMVTVREQASQPRETAWQELRDREISRTENQPRERVSVREPVREAGEDRRNNRESKHDFTNAITPTLERENIQPREITTVANAQIKETGGDSRNDKGLGEIPSSSKEASNSSNSQPGWSVLREPVAQPEKTFLQELIDREINRTENSPREMVTVREIAKEPIGTEKTSQSSSKSDSSSTIKEVPAELGGTPKNSEEPVGTEKTSQSSSKSDERLTEESLREILVNPGTTVKNPKAACKANVNLLNEGNAMAKGVTTALCADATLSDLKPTNSARKVVSATGCAAGTLSTSVCSFISDKLDKHCDSLPDAIITPPPDSDIEKIIVTFPK